MRILCRKHVAFQPFFTDIFQTLYHTTISTSHATFVNIYSFQTFSIPWHRLSPTKNTFPLHKISLSWRTTWSWLCLHAPPLKWNLGKENISATRCANFSTRHTYFSNCSEALGISRSSLGFQSMNAKGIPPKTSWRKMRGLSWFWALVWNTSAPSSRCRFRESVSLSK